jgi:drug/metabolite transporter (DMT)-like permease
MSTGGSGLSGWAILSEPVTPAMLAAMSIILFSVALISGLTLKRQPTAP